MTKKQVSKLNKIIRELEAWQNSVKLEGQEATDTTKAKELLMKVSDNND